MSHRPIRFRIWHVKDCRWIGLEAYVGAGYGDLNDACENIIVQQFTGLTDSKGQDIYEGDIMRYYTPERSCQTHEGPNIPTPDNRYTEALEPYIKTHVRAVRFFKGAFTFDSDQDVAGNGFVWPISMHQALLGSDDLVDAFSSRASQWVDGLDNETGDLIYLLDQYGLADEAALVERLNTFEVIGNIFENPYLLK